MRDSADVRPRVIRMALAVGLLLFILMLAAPAGAWSPAAVSIAASNSTSVALLDDGTVWQWGYGPGNAWRTPHQVDISGIRQISAGYGHVLALKSDGSVWAWGSNEYGQVGNDSVSSTASPVLVLMGPQIPPPASPTPVIATVPPAAATPVPANVNYLLAGAVGLLVVILAVIVAAYLLVFRKDAKKDKGKKGL